MQIGKKKAGLNAGLRQVQKQKTELAAARKEIGELKREQMAARCVLLAFRSLVSCVVWAGTICV